MRLRPAKSWTSQRRKHGAGSLISSRLFFLTKRVIDYDPFTGITTHGTYHASEDMMVVERSQDVSYLLDMNKALANETDATKEGIKNGWWHYAQIPNIIAEKWLLEHGVDVFKSENWEKNGRIWKLLNDPQYRYLKTTAKFHAG